MNLINKTIKGITWTLLENVSMQLISLLTFVILARNISASDFGTVAFAIVFIEFCQCIVSRGMSDALVQKKVINKIHLSSMFYGSIILGSLMFFFLLLISNLVEFLYQNSELSLVIKALSLSIVFDSIGITHESKIKREMEFKKLSIINISSRFMSGIVGIVGALIGWGIWALVSQNLIYSISKLILIFIFSNWLPMFKISFYEFKELFLFGIKVIGNSILSFFDSRMDVFFIGTFLGLTALGYYTIANKILIIVWQIMQKGFVRVLSTVFAKLQSNPIEFKKLFKNFLTLNFLILFPILIGGIILADELINVIFGTNWTKSILIMQIMFFGGLVYVTMGYLGVILTALGKPGLLFKIKIWITIARALALFIASQISLIVITSTNSIFAYLIITPIYIYYFKREIGINLNDFFDCFKKAFICCLFMSVALLLSINFINFNYNIFNLFLNLLIGVFVYMVFVFIFYKSEIKLFLNFNKNEKRIKSI